MKAQVSVEYIILIGFALLVALPLFYYAITESSNNIKLNQVEDAVNSIAKAADSVYSLGPGNKNYVDVMLPGGIEGVYVDNKAVRLKISFFGKSADVYSKSKADLQGSLPTTSGLHRVFVESLDSGVVEITPLIESNCIAQGYVCCELCDGLTHSEYDDSCSGQHCCENCAIIETCFDNIKNQDETDIDCGGVCGATCTDGKECGDDGDCLSNYCNVSAMPPVCYTPEDNEPPIIDLIAPDDGMVSTTSNDVVFYYNVSDVFSDIASCSLIINDTSNKTIIEPEEDVLLSFELNDIENGDYTWQINCTDNPINANEGSSEKRILTINFIEEEVYYVELWELGADVPQPADFTSGLNSTANTYWHLSGDDGWDWRDDVYSGYSTCVEFNNDEVATDGYIGFEIGDVDYGCSNSGTGSGSYGLQVYITSGMYDAIQNRGFKANLTFRWSFDDLGNGLDNNDEVWIKASFGNGTLIAMDDFESDWHDDPWSGGFGWENDWYFSGDASVQDDGEFEGTRHLRLRNYNGYVDRDIDLSSYFDPVIEFWAKANSFEFWDSASFLVSDDDTTYTTVKTWSDGEDDNIYRKYSFRLKDYEPLSDDYWIAFEADMDSYYDYFYVDAIRIYEGNITYLGSNMDTSDYADMENEIYWFDNPSDDLNNLVYYDLTELIDHAGWYYLDFGGKVYNWGNNEWGNFYFDDIIFKIS